MCCSKAHLPTQHKATGRRKGLTKPRNDGKTVSSYEKGRYFGELALQQNQPRAATIIAKGHTTCSILKAWEFDWLITQKKSLKSLLLERSGRTERASFEELPDAGADILALLEEGGDEDEDTEMPQAGGP